MAPNQKLSAGRAPARLRLALAAPLAALLAASCASLPDRTPAAQAIGPSSLSAGQSLAAAPAAWPQDSWWQSYGDPQLDALISEGLAHSPSLAEAEARIRAAEAAARARDGASGPSLSFNARVAEIEQSQATGIPADFVPSRYVDYGRATLDFSYEFDFWGRNRAGIAAASSRARAAKPRARRRG